MMTNMKRLPVLAALVLSLMIASCDSGFEEMNVKSNTGQPDRPQFQVDQYSTSNKWGTLRKTGGPI